MAFFNPPLTILLPQVGFTMEAFLAGLGRKLLCGNGTGSEMLDRVKVDFACLEVMTEAGRVRKTESCPGVRWPEQQPPGELQVS